MSQFFFREKSLGEIKSMKRGSDITGLFEQQIPALINAEEPHFLGIHFRGKQRAVLLGGVLFIFLLLISRAFYLQIMRGEHYLRLAEGNRQRAYLNYPPRGVIYDSHNKQLVGNVPTFAMAITPLEWPTVAEDERVIVEQLADLLQLDPANLLSVIQQKINRLPWLKSSNQPLVVISNLTQNQAMVLKAHENNFPGVVLTVESHRRYLSQPDPDIDRELQIKTLTPIIGYLGKINEQEWQALKNRGYAYDERLGKTGLEATYQDQLRGTPGNKIVEVDAIGKVIKNIAETRPIPGNHLQLSIDIDLQIKAASITKKWLKELGKAKATVIIMNPENGELLTLLQFPDYSYETFTPQVNSEAYEKLIKNPDQPLYPRALAGEYPPGSTLKLLVAAAALEEGIIDDTTSFLSTGGLRIDRWFYPDWQAGGHGRTNVTKALAESVNTFFYLVGGGRFSEQNQTNDQQDFIGLGVDRLTDYFSKFGLGDSLGVDLPGESSGFLPSKQWKEEIKGEPWYVGDTYHLAIGQGDILVTPLQVAAYTSAIANGGTLYKPHAVKAFIDPQTNEAAVVEPAVLNQNFVNPENLAIVRKGMREAVTYGSARYLQTLPFTAAGKTGTAEWSSDRPPHSWFTGFAPYDDPQIVITVMVEEGGEGTVAALRIARDLINLWGQLP